MNGTTQKVHILSQPLVIEINAETGEITRSEIQSLVKVEKGGAA